MAHFDDSWLLNQTIFLYGQSHFKIQRTEKQRKEMCYWDTGASFGAKNLSPFPMFGEWFWWWFCLELASFVNRLNLLFKDYVSELQVESPACQKKEQMSTNKILKRWKRAIYVVGLWGSPWAGSTFHSWRVTTKIMRMGVALSTRTASTSSPTPR